MTDDVRDETGTNEALAERITATLTVALPLIEEITRLPARQCTIRLVTPATWISETRDYVARGLQRNFILAPATPEEAQQAEKVEKLWRARTRWRWPLQRGITLTTADGEPQTLIAPRALRHMGLAETTSGLQRHVIHEAVHQAQLRFSGGLVVPAPFAIRPGPWSDRMVDDLFEGHADWAELVVTYNLLGHQWPEPETRRTSLHTQVRLRLLNARNLARTRWARLRHGTPVPASKPREYRRAVLRRDQLAHPIFESGRLFVEKTLLTTDRDLWNKVWTDPSLVPTEKEFEAPQTWLDRVGM